MTDYQKYKISNRLLFLGIGLLIMTQFLPIATSHMNHCSDDNIYGGLLLFFNIEIFRYPKTSLFAIACWLSLASIYQCKNGRYLGQKSLPLLPITALTLGIIYLFLIPTTNAVPLFSLGNYKANPLGMTVWLGSLTAILASALMQRTIPEQGNGWSVDKRTFSERLLGQPISKGQNAFTILYALSVLGWPICSFISLFSIGNLILDSISIWTAIDIVATNLLVLLYPFYYIKWLKYAFRQSRNRKRPYLFFLTSISPHILAMGCFFLIGLGLKDVPPLTP